MKGGAWPFFVGDLTCQVDFDNERDYLSLILKMLNCLFLNCTIVDMIREDVYDNRSVMLLDVLGYTRATMTNAICWLSVIVLTNRSMFGVIGIEFCYYISLTRNV